ncbi:hypothetical protein J4421_02200 [Candidatus Woesearchaeota archaeon]|nr:hypothetical protein [Candidatus Woesearchaeota archaeon]
MIKKMTHLKNKHHRRARKKESLDKDPQYMVQVNEPIMVRRDILESLRDVILFMQGYEKFRKVQEKKVMLFTLLKSQVKELSSLLQNKMYLYFPKGKLRVVSPPEMMEEEEKEEKVEEPVKKVESKPKLQPTEKTPMPPAPKMMIKPRDDLDDLELQLKDIEKQLQNIQ